ncbi:MAG TPA: hypothetical protein VEV84_02405 [Pyrinomonadaceae bacterium]|nr:hypothetical protein [Pyrinomonadaceae bacterium]
MKKAFFILFVGIACSLSAFSQKTENKPAEKPDANVADVATMGLAKAAYAAHGGDKLRTLKTLVMRGSVDLTSSAFNQAIPGGFSMAFAGDKYRIEFANPFQSFKQSYDGEQTYTSVQLGFSLPPMNRLGFPLFQRLGEKGYVVSKLPPTAKGKTGFRITAPDGFFTDFYLDDKTNQIKGYESQYEFQGRTLTTSVVIDKYRIVEGITVPEKYSQRFDLGQLIVYGDFKSKDILVNTALADDVFKRVN